MVLNLTRLLFALIALFVAGEAAILSAQTTPLRALPVDPTQADSAPPTPTPSVDTPPVVMPSSLDVVTFQVKDGGENYQMVVTTGPNLWRIDQPTDGYSIIYDPQTDHYTGLEHRNYTYWDFSWPEVKAAVSTTKRYETHLQDLNSEGVAGYDQPAGATNANGSPAPADTSIGSDNSGYVWKTTPERKKIAGIDCLHWVGETVSGESVEAWCAPGQLPKVQAAMDILRKINEPIALVPVRSLVPPLVFTFYDALIKGGSTPVLIIWGGDRNKNQFSFVSAKTHPPRQELFTVPKTYMKTTLITMDGITNPLNATDKPEHRNQAGGGGGF